MNTDLYGMIDIARQHPGGELARSLHQDNQAKTAFALGMMQRIPQEPPPPEEPPRIPSLGAMAVPN